MVKLRYKSLVVNFLIGVSGIVIGYCICSNLNAVPLLQSQNTRIAHGSYCIKGGLHHLLLYIDWRFICGRVTTSRGKKADIPAGHSLSESGDAPLLHLLFPANRHVMHSEERRRDTNEAEETAINAIKKHLQNRWITTMTRYQLLTFLAKRR